DYINCDTRYTINIGFEFTFSLLNLTIFLIAPIFISLFFLAVYDILKAIFWLLKSIFNIFYAVAVFLRLIKKPGTELVVYSPTSATAAATATAAASVVATIAPTMTAVFRPIYYKRTQVLVSSGMANAHVLASATKFVFVFNSVGSPLTDRIVACLAVSSAQCCYVAFAILSVYPKTDAICEITDDLDEQNEPETAIESLSLPVAWMTTSPAVATAQNRAAPTIKMLPAPMVQVEKADAPKELVTPSIQFRWPEPELASACAEQTSDSPTKRRKRSRSKRIARYNALKKLPIPPVAPEGHVFNVEFTVGTITIKG
ncbi:hypothetical protein LPJ64_006396, partial [Coemansia asiatica]